MSRDPLLPTGDARGRGAALALEGCVVTAPPGLSNVEIVIADGRVRSFPTRLSETLGVCLKVGPAHRPTADGRLVDLPAGGVILRAPGCVWSSPPSPVGFVSIDLGSGQLPAGAKYGRMMWCPDDRLPSLPELVRLVSSGESMLARQECLARLVDALHAVGFAGGGEALTVAPRAARRARDYMQSAYASSPSLDDLADHAGASKFSLVRLFRRTFGITPHAFLIQVRVQRARALLAAGVPPNEAALRVGFTDQSHLGRHFVRSMGMTPSVYARRVRAVVGARRPPGRS